MPKLPVYCWDANIFISWLGDEKSHTHGISAVLDEIEEGKANLVVPAIIFCEVLDFHRTKKDVRNFIKFMRRSNVVVFDVTERMANRASNIRSLARAEKPTRIIGTCDALYMATALMTSAHAFHTTETKLLKLDKSQTVEGLSICTPQTASGAKSLYP